MDWRDTAQFLTDDASDKTVLILDNKEPHMRLLSRIKKGDTFLEFPSLRTDGRITDKQLRKRWSIATEDAQIYEDDYGRQWGVPARYLTEDEQLALPKSCGGTSGRVRHLEDK